MPFWITKKKWISTDAWRGYEQPMFAVAGARDTGTWSDSPCPSGEVNRELQDLASFLRKKGVRVRMSSGQSSNVFMGKRWLVVPASHYAMAKRLVRSYITANKSETRYIHDAD
jgi:hypothetical protein